VLFATEVGAEYTFNLNCFMGICYRQNGGQPPYVKWKVDAHSDSLTAETSKHFVDNKLMPCFHLSLRKKCVSAAVCTMAPIWLRHCYPRNYGEGSSVDNLCGILDRGLININPIL
jgi:hypothetical protein